MIVYRCCLKCDRTGGKAEKVLHIENDFGYIEGRALLLQLSSSGQTVEHHHVNVSTVVPGQTCNARIRFEIVFGHCNVRWKEHFIGRAPNVNRCRENSKYSVAQELL